MAYLGDHHVAIEGASPVGCARRLNVRTDLGHNGGAKRHVGNKVAVHLAGVSVPVGRLDSMRALRYNVNVKPCCAVVDGVGTGLAQGSKVSREDRWRDDGRRRHVVAGVRIATGADDEREDTSGARDVPKREGPSFRAKQSDVLA